jgi:hypothetical protein
MKNNDNWTSATSLNTIYWQFGLLSLLSAFLLFQVQPVISKFILPWFGGGPGVWTTCLLFFQVVLFVGYSYAHALTRLPRRWQGIIHGVLVLAAAATLPIAPGPQWKPTGLEEPTGRIFLLLLANVALPYFVLSSTSPLVQVWFSRSGASREGSDGSDGNSSRSPWRLYALSNIGSLAALLTYPFLIEPRWDVMQQTDLWSAAFLLFGLLSCVLAFIDSRSVAAIEKNIIVKDFSAEPNVLAMWLRRLLWVLLPAVASVLLLASTNHLCQDVAVIPFLWVIPLSLYLLSFIICFEYERWYVRTLWALPAMALLLLTGTHKIVDGWLLKFHVLTNMTWVPVTLTPNFQAQIALASGAMFWGCMVCHGELVRLKPEPKYLTSFYLLMSAGGAIGGLFVSLAAPYLFKTYSEWPGILMASFLIAAIVLCHSAWSRRRKPLRWLLMVVVVLIMGLGIYSFSLSAFKTEDRVARERNFYGVISVGEDVSEDGSDLRTLFHGEILHGKQYLAQERRNEPLSYYGHDTGIGRALLKLNKRTDAHVGVVGMGAATVAAYGEKGHVYRFYEINPEIVHFAREWFYFLGDLEHRGGTVQVIMGDARRSLENDPSQQFDVLLLDAFSGDSVPVHLLTREAFEIYQRHMKSDGIIAVHVTNRYLDIAPVVEKVAASLSWKTTRVSTDSEGLHDSTDYVMVTNDENFLRENSHVIDEKENVTPVSLWSDDANNLFEILLK